MDEKRNDFTFSEFSDPDIQRLIQLTENTYPGQDISKPAYLDWEYLRNPDGKAILFVAQKMNELYSQYIILPRKYFANTEVLNGSLSVNTLTHPDARGQGLFPKLAELTYDKASRQDIQFTVGFPNPVSSPVFRSKLKFSTLGYLPLYVKILKPLNVLKKYFSKGNLKRGEEHKIEFSNSEIKDGFTIELFDPEMDASEFEKFHQKFLKSKKYCTLRDLAYLKWRYLDIPLRNYRMYKITREGMITAIIVFRITEFFGLKTVSILELMKYDEPESKTSAGVLLNWLSTQARNHQLDLMMMAFQDLSTGKITPSKHGFLPVPVRFLPQSLEFILRIHLEKGNIRGILDFNNWYLSLGDLDTF